MKKTRVDGLLSLYPKERPALTEAHRKIFVDEYKINRGGKGWLYGVIKFLESWHHKQIAKLEGAQSVLEIGAGSMNHLPYEQRAEIYDCIEPFEELYQNSQNLDRVNNIYSDISDLPENSSYQRIISIGVLEHLEDLPRITAQSGLMLSPDGVFQASIPSEGGLLWGLSWRMTTAVAYRLRTGLDYKTVMKHEHINDAFEIRAVLNYFFENVKVKRFPFPGIHFSFYTYIEATNPRRHVCQKYLGMAD